ncbi:hypothetical protein GM418_03200 [Maribellus comscasis]|uniref:Uncharacterized protein n=1 Tax=Maribellus comscasis TaxID=2681766 RepID=A0A6I6JYA3_9BACT|nr:hypothetical protein [Maribellus comscasis]QGY42694.1 hypothetical protein GM418_03200 [Maribellus comscasis]
MKKRQRNERVLFIASGIFLFSIFLMMVTTLLVITKVNADIIPKASAIAISVAVIIHLIIFMGYVKFIRESRRRNKNRNGEYIGIGVVIILLGFVYLDGAVAYWNQDDMFVVSVLMFSSILCNLTASVITIVLYYLRPQK